MLWCHRSSARTKMRCCSKIIFFPRRDYCLAKERLLEEQQGPPLSILLYVLHPYELLFGVSLLLVVLVVLEGAEEAVEVLGEQGPVFEAYVDDVKVLELRRCSLPRSALRRGRKGKDDAPKGRSERNKGVTHCSSASWFFLTKKSYQAALSETWASSSGSYTKTTPVASCMTAGQQDS